MKRRIHSFPLLGFIILTASAAIGAMLPNGVNKSKFLLEDGQLVKETDNENGLTCKPGGHECVNTVSGPSPLDASGDTNYCPENCSRSDDTTV